MTVAITREGLDAGELRREAGPCPAARAARRMLGLELVLEGASREAAARCAGMDRRTLRDWVHRYNAEGIEGLRDRRRPGRGRGSRPRRRPSWRRPWTRGRTGTAWCAGDGSTSG